MDMFLLLFDVCLSFTVMSVTRGPRIGGHHFRPKLLSLTYISAHKPIILTSRGRLARTLLVPFGCFISCKAQYSVIIHAPACSGGLMITGRYKISSKYPKYPMVLFLYRDL